MSEHVLYRFYSHTGQLLYVGITANPPSRFKSHGDSKSWWNQVAGITIETCTSREELAAAERRAIQIEHPMHNIHHNRVSRSRFSHKSNQQVGEITYSCDACKSSIKGDQGYIYVSYLEMEQVRRARREIDTNRIKCPICGKISVYIQDSDRYLHSDGTSNEDCWIAISQGVVNKYSHLIWTGSDLMNYPRPARWRVYHRSCDPEPDGDAYWFDVERADSYSKLLSWTAHLMEKNWLEDTNWKEFLYRHLSDRAKAC